ncbi:RICIN domain-containing protein [Pedobacter borealis]|uniref:RICIN domain-containing protein n=1 Tax=Pedobacter borealis TaxID=475254 RepID=UPI000492F4DC|nr:RICIN domain-containing protein [Pedobacter borealis]
MADPKSFGLQPNAQTTTSGIALGEWFYLQSEMSDGSGESVPFVMALSGTSFSAGTVVVIEPLQANSPGQRWMMISQGVIINALNLTMALTAGSSAGTNVTMQPIVQGAINQIWTFQNGLLSTDASGSALYLNVYGGGNSAPGQPLITYALTSGTNELWQLIPLNVSDLWFTILPITTPDNLLTTSLTFELSVAPKTDPWNPSAQPTLTQLWRRTIEGYILSAANPDLALTGGITVSVAPLCIGNTNQQWQWEYAESESIQSGGGTKKIPAGTLWNVGQNKSLYANGGMVGLGTQPQGTEFNSWYILPYAMPFGQSTTIRNVTDSGEAAGLFLTMPEKPDKSKIFQISTAALSGQQELTMWQYQYPGYIINSAYPDVALSLEVAPGSTIAAPIFTTNVVAYPLQASPQRFQLWSITPEGYIINQQNNSVLTGSATNSSVTVGVMAVSPATPESSFQVWDFSPGMALQTVLAQPSYPFPAWTANQKDAYNSISSQLGVPSGIRTQYVNLAAPLNSYQSSMNLMVTGLLNGGTLPGGVIPTQLQIEDLHSVAIQLNKEITAVSATQLLFQQMTTLFLSLSQAQEMMLSELITLCALPQGLQTKIPPQKKKRPWLGDLVEGLLYAGMNVAGSFVGDPDAGTEASDLAKFTKNGLPCIANLMSAGWATAQGAKQDGSLTAKYVTALQKAEQNFYNYEMTVAEIQQELLNEFEAVVSALGKIETFILSDWGKLHAVYQMTNSLGHISSLFWPSTMSAMNINQMLTGYTIGVLRTLLPANAANVIKATMHTNYQASSPLPPGLQSNGSFVENNNDGTQNVFTTTVNQEIMDMLWNYGITPFCFFKGLDGWHLPVQYQQMVGTKTQGVPAGASVIVTVENFTNSQLTLTLTLGSLVGKGSYFSYPFEYTAQTYLIAPHGVQQFAGASWCYLNPSNKEDDPLSLQGSSSSSGIQITADGQTVMTVGVTNSYSIFGGGTYPAPASITFSKIAFDSEYDCKISQSVTPSGMVLATISVSSAN